MIIHMDEKVSNLKVLQVIARLMIGILLGIIGFFIATSSLMEKQHGFVQIILFIILFGMSYGAAGFLCFGKKYNDIFLYFPIACILGMIVWIWVIIFSLLTMVSFGTIDRWILLIGFLWCAITVVCKTEYSWFRQSS